MVNDVISGYQYRRQENRLTSMGRHLRRKVSDVGFEDYRPGCMWGMLHILDYHYCHNSKKLPLRRKHGRGKHVRCCKNPRTVSFDLYTDEAQEYLSAKAVPFPVEQQALRTSSTNRITRKAQIKALISKEIFARTRLQQTDPVHQLGPSSKCLATMDSDLSNPIIILHKSADTAASRLQIPSVSKTPEELVAHNCRFHLPGTESVDVLEIFKLNEKLLVEILKDPDIQRTWDPDIQSTHVQLPSKAKVRLRRSGSFPAADCSHIRVVRPSTIEHKLKEIWSFPKGVKSSIGTQEPRSAAFGPLRDFHEKSIDLKASDHGVTSIAQETQLSSLKPSQGLHKHRWHILLMSLVKGLQKKIKNALTESKRESNHVSTNASIYRVSSGCKFSTDEEEMSEKLKENTMNGDGIENPTSFQETNGFDNDLSKGQVPHMRRGSSLKESLNGYARLFEYSFSKEAKWHQYQSKSLKLSSGDKFQSSGLKSFRRRLSLPDIESMYHIPNEFSGDALSPRTSNMTGMDPDANANNDIHNHLESVCIPEVRKQFETTRYC
ncbi:PROTEIN TRM32 [Salix koriyanagi]|uniref:PROTEIN TRM32 n=1 Tax=Salix koriyanagi TaxID=2511006 RepID=A0A9Q1ANE7_9ROSI|nr:PROTEIN TRM32 [Salix koriyanagi]